MVQYLGGKTRIASEIVKAILADGADTGFWWEPFVGGGGVMEKAAPVFRRCVGSDIHADLILMWRASVNGWSPGDVNRDLYAELRNSPPSPMRGFVGFGASFGGRWFEGYGVSPRDGELWKASRRTLARQARVFRKARVTFLRASYEELLPPKGSTVYCDPPYSGTKGYSGTARFDSDPFFRTAISWAERSTVYVSEYALPDWVPSVEVWSREVSVSVGARTNSRGATEKLFRIAP